MRPTLTLRHYTHDLIAHSHEHAQVVISLSGQLDFEVEGRPSLLRQQQLMVVPAGAHHTCGSPQGSHCLVLDVPGDNWLGQSLGAHADASRRLLDTAGHLPLDPQQHQLVNWLATSPVSDPLIARQGAILLLALAILVVRYASSQFPSVKIENPHRKTGAGSSEHPEVEKGEL